MNFITDKKYIISLLKRDDRRDKILKSLIKMNVFNSDVFYAIDGKAIDYTGKFKKGQAGCRLSHLEVIKNAKKENLPHVIIIEDDALFASDFLVSLTEIKIPEDWQMFYFGAHNHRQLEMINSRIGRCVTTLSTICYAVKSSIYDMLIEELQKDDILDIIYCNKIHSKINAYCAYPNLATQATGYSDIEQGYVKYDKFYSKW